MFFAVVFLGSSLNTLGGGHGDVIHKKQTCPHTVFHFQEIHLDQVDFFKISNSGWLFPDATVCSFT